MPLISTGIIPLQPAPGRFFVLHFEWSGSIYLAFLHGRGSFVETTYWIVAGSVIAVVAIYFFWVRKLGTNSEQASSSASSQDARP